jgi:hypothetical protein
MIDKGLLHRSFPSFSSRDNFQETERKICNTLTMEPTISPKQSSSSTPHLRIYNRREESMNLLWNTNIEISPWTIWICLL